MKKNLDDHDLVLDPFKDDSLIDRIVFFFKNLFTGSGDSDFERKKLLWKIRGDLNSTKHKVYDIKRQSLTPSFAELLFEIYKYTHPMGAIIKIDDSKVQNRIEDFFLEIQLTKEQQDLLVELSEDKFKEYLNNGGTKELDKKVNETLKIFQKSFTKEQVEDINLTFSRFMEIYHLVHFDLYGFLKKFAPGLKENTVSQMPKFRHVEARYLVEQLQDFSEIIYSMDVKGNYTRALTIFGTYKGNPILPEKEIKILISQIESIIKMNYIPLILSYVFADPHFRPVQNIKTINLVQNFINRYITVIRNRREKVVKEIKDIKISSVANEIFKNIEIKKLDHYSDSFRQELIDFDIAPYNYVEALSYIRLFIMEIYNHYIRDTLNNLVVQGDFVSERTKQQFNESYFVLNDILKEINSFDNSLAEGTATGVKIKTLLRKATQEVNSRRSLASFINNIDNEAKELTLKSMLSIDFIAGHLKIAYGDYKTNSKKLVSNIKKVGQDNNEFMNNIIRAYNSMAKLNALLKAIVPYEIKMRLQNSDSD